MKRFVFGLTILLAVVLSCQAQPKTGQRTPEERAAIQTEWMKENLKLNANQASAVESLNLEYARKMETVKQVDGKMAQLKKAKSISEEKDAKLKAVLDSKQFQTYLEKKKELRAKAMEMYQEQNQ